MKSPYNGAYGILLTKYKSLEKAYDAQNLQYRGQLVKTVTLQAQIDELEKLIYYYKNLGKTQNHTS